MFVLKRPMLFRATSCRHFEPRHPGHRKESWFPPRETERTIGLSAHSVHSSPMKPVSQALGPSRRMFSQLPQTCLAQPRHTKTRSWLRANLSCEWILARYACGGLQNLFLRPSQCGLNKYWKTIIYLLPCCCGFGRLRHYEIWCENDFYYIFIRI